MTAEKWREIAGAPGYQVSDLGRIRNPRKRILKGGLTNSGYRTFSLPGRGQSYAHHLVLEAFVSPSTGETANHINGDKLDNRAANLEWCSYAENNAHAARTGLRSNTQPGAKLRRADVRQIRQAYARGETRQGLAEQFGVTASNIWYIVTGRTWVNV